MNTIDSTNRETAYRYHLNKNIDLGIVQGQKRTVYLVDDDEDDLFLSSKSLLQSPRVKTVNQVHDASDLFNVMRQDGCFDDKIICSTIKLIILLDIHMPNVSGIEILEMIKDHPITSDLSVILLSSDLSADKVHKAYDLQAHGYLEKPCKLECFHSILDDIEVGANSFKVGNHYLN